MHAPLAAVNDEGADAVHEIDRRYREAIAAAHSTYWLMCDSAARQRDLGLAALVHRTENYRTLSSLSSTPSHIPPPLPTLAPSASSPLPLPPPTTAFGSGRTLENSPLAAIFLASLPPPPPPPSSSSSSTLSPLPLPPLPPSPPHSEFVAPQPLSRPRVSSPTPPPPPPPSWFAAAADAAAASPPAATSTSAFSEMFRVALELSRSDVDRNRLGSVKLEQKEERATLPSLPPLLSPSWCVPTELGSAATATAVAETGIVGERVVVAFDPYTATRGRDANEDRLVCATNGKDFGDGGSSRRSISTGGVSGGGDDGRDGGDSNRGTQGCCILAFAVMDGHGGDGCVEALAHPEHGLLPHALECIGPHLRGRDDDIDVGGGGIDGVGIGGGGIGGNDIADNNDTGADEKIEMRYDDGGSDLGDGSGVNTRKRRRREIDTVVATATATATIIVAATVRTEPAVSEPVATEPAVSEPTVSKLAVSERELARMKRLDAAVKRACVGYDRRRCCTYWSGSTVTALLLKKRDPQRALVFNVGDSRTLLIHLGRGEIVLATRDHKPDAPDELARIERAGGYVCRDADDSTQRVQGVLALSHAFGNYRPCGRGRASNDLPLKTARDTDAAKMDMWRNGPRSGSTWTATGGGGGVGGPPLGTGLGTGLEDGVDGGCGEVDVDPVSAMPDAYEVVFDADGDYLALMASDGLWDAVGNERALEIVMDAYARQRRSAQSVGQRSSPAGGGQRSSPAGGESATFSENGAPPPEFVAGPEFAAAITTALVAESALSPDNLSIALVAVLAPRVRASN